MRLGVLMLVVSVLVTHTAAQAEEPDVAADGARFVGARYHALEGNHFLLDTHLRFRVPEGHEVGWRLAFGQYRQEQAAVWDQHLQFGPVWAFSAPRMPRRCLLRLGFEPWATVWTVRRSTGSAADTKLRFGADASATIRAEIRLTRVLSVSPGVGVVVRLARATNDVAPSETEVEDAESNDVEPDDAEPSNIEPSDGEPNDTQSAVRRWDSNTACRLSLAVWLGRRQRLKIEAAYSIPLRTATQLADERWALDLAWKF